MAAYLKKSSFVTVLKLFFRVFICCHPFCLDRHHTFNYTQSTFFYMENSFLPDNLKKINNDTTVIAINIVAKAAAIP